MKKVVMLLIFAVSAIGVGAHAADCPLKNLKKNQTRQADGTAFIPGNAPQSKNSSNSSQGTVFIGN